MSERTYQTGLEGEEQARKYLESMGMIFVRSRYRCGCGEIDLVMMDGNVLVFVEVKTRSTGKNGNGLLAVDRKKQTRLARAAVVFMREFRHQKDPARFDVVEINRNGILYIRDAFRPGLPT